MGIVILAAACLPLGRPAWRALKSWRADQFLAEAQELLDQQQFSLAFDRARSALQLVPTGADALRLNARLLTTAGSDASLDLWRRLLASGRATQDDRAAYVETALTLDRPDLIRDIIAAYEAADPPSDRDQRLAALFHLQTRDLESALRCAELAHRLDPVDPTNTVLLARLLAGQTNQPALARAGDLLWGVAQTNGPLRLEALRQLAVSPRFREDRANVERIRDLLRSIPDRNPEEETLCAETEIELDPSGAASVISNLVSRVRPGDWENLGLVVDALRRQGRNDEVIDLTSEGRGLMSRSLFLGRFDALLATGQTAEAYRLTLSGEAPLSPFDLGLLRVRAAQESGDLDRRDRHLRDLLRIAEDHPDRLLRTAQIAASGGTPAALAVAMDAWKQMGGGRDQPQSTNALRHLQHLADMQGDTWTARDYARRAARLDPQDTGLRLEIAYYDLLLDENMDRALAEAERQLQTRTNDLFVRATAALGHLRLGAPARAREVLDRFVVTQQVARNDALAVVVATYGANGFDQRARELAGRLPLAALRPEERELIRKWLLPAPLGL